MPFQGDFAFCQSHFIDIIPLQLKSVILCFSKKLQKMNRKRGLGIILPTIIIINLGIFVLLITGSSPTPEDGAENNEISTLFTPVKIPDSVTFAGELIPLSRFDVRESLDRELLVNSYFHSQTLRLLKLAPRYFSVIEPILKEKGMPDDLKYLAVAESGLNPRAISPAGAVGLWQFMHGTAREYGLTINNEIDERYHIEKSTFAACDYLMKSFQRFETWSMVAAAYNAGNSGVQRQMLRQKNSSYFDLLFNEETARYFYRIIALKLIMENPGTYNFVIADDERYPVIPTREVVITGRVADFADFAATHGISYKLLKDFNPWLRESFLTNAGGKKYTVKIPVLD